MTNTVLDAGESLFLTRQLTYIKSKIYEVDYPEFKSSSLIPVSMEAGPGAESILYYQFDKVGMAKVIANYADDLPSVEAFGKEYSARVRSLGAKYEYSVQEIRNAQMAGVNLSQRKANAARFAIEQKQDDIAWNGDADFNLVGLLNNANVTRIAAPADGTASATTFASKDDAKMLRDLNTLTTKIVEITKGVETPNTLLMPIHVYTRLATTQMSGINSTVLEFFLKSNPMIERVEWLNQCVDAGQGISPLSAGEDVIVAYRNDPNKLEYQVPVPFEQFPEQQKGLCFEVPCHARVGGVTIYKPLSVAILEGV